MPPEHPRGDQDHDAHRPGRGHPHPIEIVINGRPATVADDEVSFEEIVKLAFPSTPPNPNTIFTVTYRRAAGHPADGILIEGGTVKVKKGTIFNVTATDKS